MQTLKILVAWGLVTSCALETPTPPAHSVKPVLIVIAPVDFYYQEYADPRQALEEAGLMVKVASITANPDAPATPHDPSWEGDRPTTIDVAPDLALADVDPADYSSLVIAGGWGATTYFYAFTDAPFLGDPVNGNYDRNATASERLNALINAFLSSQKPILGVCNGVNVLSWARVTGTSDSPLKGKRVSAPHQPVPAMSYKSVSYEDGSSLQMPKFVLDNEGIVEPKDSVGDDDSNRDDVSIDGLILTAQDNYSAYAGGRALARALGKEAP